MRFLARVQRLESARARREDASGGERSASALRLHRAIMNDPVAHDLFVRIVALTPDALHVRDFDFYKAAAERPGLAEAAAELSRRLGPLVTQCDHSRGSEPPARQ